MTKQKEVSNELKLYKSVMYLHLHRKWEEKSRLNSYVLPIHEAHSYLMKNEKIPKNLCSAVLKEMEKMGLINYSRYEIIIIPGESKSLNNISKINKQLGLW